MDAMAKGSKGMGGLIVLQTQRNAMGGTESRWQGRPLLLLASELAGVGRRAGRCRGWMECRFWSLNILNGSKEIAAGRWH